MEPQHTFYFFGKLEQSRDFVASDNIEAQDRYFWEEWFGRCNNQHRLMPFTRKTPVRSRIWLFCIRLHQTTYTGLTTLSSDQTGRSYPFVLFQKHNTSEGNMLFHLQKANSQTTLFETMLSTTTENRHHCIHQVGHTDFPFPLVQRLQALPNGADSMWYSFSDRHYLESEGTPSCSLFNKLFGL